MSNLFGFSAALDRLALFALAGFIVHLLFKAAHVLATPAVSAETMVTVAVIALLGLVWGLDL